MNTPAQQVAPRRYSAKEAAALLGISGNSIYAHIRVGHIKAVRLGRKIIILGEEVDRILREGAPALPTGPGTVVTQADPLG